MVAEEGKVRRRVHYPLKQGDNIILTTKTKDLEHTFDHEGFPDSNDYSVVVIASDPASQQAEMSKSIDDGGEYYRNFS